MVDLLHDPAYRAWHRRMTDAARLAERASAYGCAQRGVPFDPADCARLYAARDQVRDECPEVSDAA